MPYFATVTVMDEAMKLSNLTLAEELQRKQEQAKFHADFWEKFEQYQDDTGWEDYQELSDEEYAQDIDCSINDWNEMNEQKY